MAVSPHQMSRRALWFWWMLATAMGITVGAVVLVSVFVATSSDLFLTIGRFGEPVRFIFYAVTGGVIGAVLGAAQYLALRQRIQRARQWLLASTAGMAIGNVFAPLTRDIAYRILYGNTFLYEFPGITPDAAATTLAIAAAVAGAVVGIAQWLFLRRRISRAGWWVLASALSWGIGVIPGQFGGMALASTGWMPKGWPILGELFLGVWYASGLPIVGVVVGAITGLALVMLLREYTPAVAEADKTAGTSTGSGR